MNLIVLRLSTRFLFLISNIIFAWCDKDTRCTVTHDRAENPVFGRKLSARRNTRDTSCILRTWRECAHVLGHDYVAEKFGMGKATLIIIVSFFLSLGRGCDRHRETLSNNAVDRRPVIKLVSLSFVYRSDSVSNGNHLPPPESTSLSRHYTMLAADAPMRRWVIASSWMRKGFVTKPPSDKSIQRTN